MPGAKLEDKLAKFYDEFYMYRLFTPVWIGWRRFSRKNVYRAFKYVLGEQLRLGNINAETYNGIVTETNGLVTQITSQSGWRHWVNRDIIADFRKKMEENPEISSFLRYAQSEPYLMKANELAKSEPYLRKTKVL